MVDFIVMANRRSWFLRLISPEGWPAGGFVYKDENQSFWAIIELPHVRTRPPTKDEQFLIGRHDTLSDAQDAVEQFAVQRGLSAVGRWS